MPKIGRLIHQNSGDILLTEVHWCSSFVCKLRGLMFRRQLHEGEGLLLVEGFESRTATAIHMLFMAFPIAVVWFDTSFRVVDVKLARPWRLAYVPKSPACYTLESSPDLLAEVKVGDVLIYEGLHD